MLSVEQAPPASPPTRQGSPSSGLHLPLPAAAARPRREIPRQARRGLSLGGGGAARELREELVYAAAVVAVE